jgi:alkanesulfonate monooxygenase SsuD/methylene tetrahydromethanopterin reductase-like flavin-dependent oxidoreductase (luciferase family)
MIVLGVLDQSPIRSGATPADAIAETLELAQAAERLGYHRYWLAEHHATGGLACTAPEILIGQVAVRTSTIRVGSGGVMLTHYSALKVAECFRMLEALSPAASTSASAAPPAATAARRARFATVPGPCRREFRPSPWLAAPRASVAAFALVADTEAEALRLARSRDLYLARLYTGRFGPYPSIEETEAHPWTEQELAIAHHTRRRTIAGTPEQVHERLLALAGEYQADELVVVTITHDFKARLRSYELLAQVFGLTPRHG